VYTADPKTDPTATRYDKISYTDVLAKGLAATDLTAAALGLDTEQTLFLFALSDPQNIIRVVQGEHIGTLVTR